VHIQLALDRLTIEQAIAVAKRVSAYIDWIEVGTSLIKEFGMESVKAIRQAFPDHMIVADTKTFDNAIYEFEMCYAAGADIVTVMGAAPRLTVEASMNVAVKRGKLAMIDLLHTTEEQVKWLSAYSEAVFCLHVSKDEQEMRGGAQGANTVPESLLQGTKRKLAFAGGITADSLVKLMSFEPYAAIVGSAITQAKNPVLAARAFTAFK
jgi:3-hexulose-6-phosphate synthase